MKKYIFKVQTDIKKKQHLLYNENQTIWSEFPFDDVLFRLVGMKGFVEGYINDRGQLVVLKKVENKGW